MLRHIYRPLPTIFWKKNGVDVKPTSGSPQHEFHIRHAQYNDSGDYECRGHNSFGGSGWIRIRLRVQCRFTQTFPKTAGHKLFLTCY